MIQAVIRGVPDALRVFEEASFRGRYADPGPSCSETGRSRRLVRMMVRNERPFGRRSLKVAGIDQQSLAVAFENRSIHGPSDDPQAGEDFLGLGRREKWDRGSRTQNASPGQDTTPSRSRLSKRFAYASLL